MQATLERDVDAPAEMRQYLRFVLADAVFAVPIDSVREILELGPTTALPMMPSFVRGVMNLRGAVVPVIDLAARYNLPPTIPGRRTCIVVVEVTPSGEHDGPRQVLGLLVDAVHEVLEASTADMEDPPSLGTRISPHYIAGITRAHGTMVLVLDLPRSLDDEELARLIASDAAVHA